MLSPEQADEIKGQALLDHDDNELGPIDEVFLNPGDDTPAWAAVQHEGHRLVVPLDGAQLEEEGVRVRYSADQIAGAPESDGEALDPDLQDRLYEHYGISDATLRDDDGFATEAIEEDDDDEPEADPE